MSEEGCGGQEVFIAWWSSSAAQARVKTSPSLNAKGRAFLSKETRQHWGKKVLVERHKGLDTRDVLQEHSMVTLHSIFHTYPEPGRRLFLGKRHY